MTNTPHHNSPAQQSTAWQINSERCLTVSFSPTSFENQQLCWGMYDELLTHPDFCDIAEMVIGMNTLSVYTHPMSWDKLWYLKGKLDEYLTVARPKMIAGKHIDIPVVYGGKDGVDLKACAKVKKMSVAELVKAHTTPVYTVYFIGFQAGFPYLGGLPKQLHMPRHAVPRKHVPAGSVGIGGEQTGIYPFDSPGGWQLLGRTKMSLFEVSNTPPTLLKAGDTLSFVATDILD